MASVALENVINNETNVIINKTLLERIEKLYHQKLVHNILCHLYQAMALLGDSIPTDIYRLPSELLPGDNAGRTVAHYEILQDIKTLLHELKHRFSHFVDTRLQKG